MSEAQRVGQLFAVGLEDDRLGPGEAAMISRYHFGSVTFIVTTTVGAAQIRAVTDGVQSLATSQPGGLGSSWPRTRKEA